MSFDLLKQTSEGTNIPLIHLTSEDLYLSVAQKTFDLEVLISLNQFSVYVSLSDVYFSLFS